MLSFGRAAMPCCPMLQTSDQVIIQIAHMQITGHPLCLSLIHIYPQPQPPQHPQPPPQPLQPRPHPLPPQPPQRPQPL